MTEDLQEITTSYMTNYEKDFGTSLSVEDAKDSLYNLLGYVKILEKIHKRVELDKRLKSKKFLKILKSDNMDVDTT